MSAAARPFVLLSVAASIDGYIDDSSDDRLLLSNDEDFDRVDEVRAGVDAILVGASTIRADNPRLMVRSEARKAARAAAGKSPSLIKVTVTGSGDLDPEAKFFTAGEEQKLVYTSASAHADLSEKLGEAATVVDAGDPIDLERLLADLAARGVERLMVEGGGSMHTQFLQAGVVDELHLVIAPFLIGDPAAPRFVNPGDFPQGPRSPFKLAESRAIGDVVLLRYRTG
ncbi:MAG TPA: dihydrofolate reductase family protein [Glycomyces sp.]|nr:dihydrofolate reductase family protein [Glycomyces sp.]